MKKESENTTKFKLWSDLKKGQKFIVVTNSNSHNYPTDRPLTMRMDGIPRTSMNDVAEECAGNNLEAKDCRMYNLNRDIITQKIIVLKEEIKDLNNKLFLMDELGIDTYDPEMFKVYETIRTIKDTTLSDIEKAEKITKLFRQ
jgi:hypothetical protein